jgi:hypothetical protein
MNAASAPSLQAVGPNEAKAIMDPGAYAYAAPNQQQQQQMYQQFVQMAFFAFSQMQMQSAMGMSHFPGAFPFAAPAFCGMPPLPPGERARLSLCLACAAPTRRLAAAPERERAAPRASDPRQRLLFSRGIAG